MLHLDPSRFLEFGCFLQVIKKLLPVDQVNLSEYLADDFINRGK